jgi:hypothetical protein
MVLDHDQQPGNDHGLEGVRGARSEAGQTLINYGQTAGGLWPLIL